MLIFRFRCSFLIILWTIFQIFPLSGCKKISDKDSQPSESKLDQFYDETYFFYLTPVSKQDEHLAYGVVDEELGHMTNAFHFKVCKKHPTDKPITIIPGSCTYAYRDKHKQPLILYALPQDQIVEQMKRAQFYLAQRAMRWEHENNYHVAAFGTGASLNVFSGYYHKALVTAVPKLAGNSLATKMARWGVKLGITMTPHHLIPSDSFTNLAMTDQGFIALSADEMPINKLQHTATGAASAAAGFGSGMLLTYLGSLTAPLTGPYGVLIAESIIPITVTIVLNTSYNPAKKLMDNFLSLTNVTNLEKAINSDFTIEVKEIPPIIKMVGQMMTLSGWASNDKAFYYCLEKNPDQCNEVNPEYSITHYGQ